MIPGNIKFQSRYVCYDKQQYDTAWATMRLKIADGSQEKPYLALSLPEDGSPSIFLTNDEHGRDVDSFIHDLTGRLPAEALPKSEWQIQHSRINALIRRKALKTKRLALIREILAQNKANLPVESGLLKGSVFA
jgi:hypothetical protein